MLRVEEGSLYPALYRMEEQGLIEAEWRPTENHRTAKFYTLTRKGRRAAQAELDGWLRYPERSHACCAQSSRRCDVALRPPRFIRRVLALFRWRSRDDDMEREMAFMSIRSRVTTYTSGRGGRWRLSASFGVGDIVTRLYSPSVC